jgi:hypothetical protein
MQHSCASHLIGEKTSNAGVWGNPPQHEEVVASRCAKNCNQLIAATSESSFRVQIAENVAAGKIAKTLAYLAGTGCEVRSFVREWWNFGAPGGTKPLTPM